MVAAAKQDSPAVAAADPFSPHSPWADKKWMVYRGKAYDITDFISKHPGGGCSTGERGVLDRAI
jgi:hypothetical protein